jgi:hypothetical protein
MGILRHWPWNKNDWREWCVRGVASGGAPPSREQMAFNVLTLYPMMNYLGSESMVENLETNFSKAIQIGFAKATRCLKGMQKVFRHRRGIG